MRNGIGCAARLIPSSSYPYNSIPIWELNVAYDVRQPENKWLTTDLIIRFWKIPAQRERLWLRMRSHVSRIHDQSCHHKISCHHWLLWQFLRVSPLFVQSFLLFVSERRQRRRWKKSRSIFSTTITAFSTWKRLECVYIFLRLLLWCPCTQRLNTDYYTTNRSERKRSRDEQKKRSTTQRFCWVYISFYLCVLSHWICTGRLSVLLSYIFCCFVFLCVAKKKFNRIIYEYKWKKKKKNHIYTQNETI